MTDNNSKNQTQPAKKVSEHPKPDETLQFGLEIAPMPILVPANSVTKVEKSVVERLVQKVKDL